MNELAPIVLFVYNRPWHTEQTLNALMKNKLADESVLYIYADGPKEKATDDQIKKITEVRQLIRSKTWCKEVHTIEAEKNKGLADSIIDGVTQIVNEYGKIIVLEDDIVTSKGFLKYMNEGLALYENEDQVMQISAFMFPIDSKRLPDTFFYNANSCWGWGTWKRAWNYFEKDAQKLYAELNEKEIDWSVFNAHQGNAFQEQLLANINKTINTWAVKWHTSIGLNSGFVLHPKKSLTKNIGFDGSGTYSDANSIYNKIELAKKIRIKKIDSYSEDRKAEQALKNYFNKGSKVSSFNIIKNSFLKLVGKF